ncbi:MAG: hypothetical protein P8184_19585 [Calditrichia bacterium]
MVSGFPYRKWALESRKAESRKAGKKIESRKAEGRGAVRVSGTASGVTAFWHYCILALLLSDILLSDILLSAFVFISFLFYIGKNPHALHYLQEKTSLLSGITAFCILFFGFSHFFL